MKLGKLAPRLDRRTLKLADYITPALPEPPLEAGYVEEISTWPMYLNDALGDCVIAAAGHMIQQWTAYSGKGAILDNNAILKGYEAVGGYVPGDPNTDNGCVMLDALNYWRQTGFGGHKIVAYASVNPSNQKEIQQAIAIFGNVYTGLALPITAQNPKQTPTYPCWQFPRVGQFGDGSPGSWGGHCVPIIGYSNNAAGNPGTLVVTWGQPYDMTWPFLQAYCDELYAIVTKDWISKAGKSPTGLALKDLLADLHAVT